MRARNLKPGIFKNELLGGSDPLHSLLFEGLWCMADREGRLEDRPLRICAELFPYRRNVNERKVETMLQWLHENGFIVRYTVECGNATGSDQTRNMTKSVTTSGRYIQIVEFLKHQKPHKNEQPSQIPSLRLVSAQPRSGLKTDQNPSVDAPRSVASTTKALSARASSLNPSSLNPHSLNVPSGNAREDRTPDGPLASAQGHLAGRINGSGNERKGEGDAVTASPRTPSHTTAELEAIAHKMAAEGVDSGLIADTLERYGISRDQVRGWLANGANGVPAAEGSG